MSCLNHDWTQFRCPNCSDPVGSTAPGPKTLTADTVIADRDVLRWDYDGSPRFYYVRIWPHDPRECQSNPHLYTPRVQVRVELEGDPTAWHETTPDDDPECVNEAVLDCIAEIEEMRGDQWDEEQWRQRREEELDYWRSR